MPRMISFSMTTPQFVEGTKSVTRRTGWVGLKAGTLLVAVEKAMGLKRGEKVRRLGLIRVVDARRERLSRMTDDAEYGRVEVQREGFPLWTPQQFVDFFCVGHGCEAWATVTRIEFERVDESDGRCRRIFGNNVAANFGVLP